MTMWAMSDVTLILSQIQFGDPAAAEQLVPLVYATGLTPRCFFAVKWSTRKTQKNDHCPEAKGRRNSPLSLDLRREPRREALHVSLHTNRCCVRAVLTNAFRVSTSGDSHEPFQFPSPGRRPANCRGHADFAGPCVGRGARLPFAQHGSVC